MKHTPVLTASVSVKVSPELISLAERTLERAPRKDYPTKGDLYRTALALGLAAINSKLDHGDKGAE